MPKRPASYETKDLKKLKVADLRAILESKGLDATGKKDELIEKVQASNDAPEPVPEPAPEPEKSPPAMKPAAMEPAQKETPPAAEEEHDDDERRRAINYFFSTADAFADDDDHDDDDDVEMYDVEPAPEPEAPIDRDDDGRREAAGDGPGGGGVPRGKSPNRLYVLGLPRHVTEVLLKEFFGRFGAVTDARVLASRDGEDDGGPRRGTVTFASAADAARARAETDNTRAFHGGGELKVIHSNLREGEGGRRGGGGGGGRGGGASAQPWSVYPMQPGMPMYTPMAAVALDPATGQPIAPTGGAAGAGPAGHPATVPPTGLSEAGYTGVHLAGLPPSATVDAKYAHLYQ